MVLTLGFPGEKYTFAWNLNSNETLGHSTGKIFLLSTFSLCSIPCFLLVLVRAIVLSLLDFGIFRNSKIIIFKISNIIYRF